jgi:hypothetical protein
MGLQTIQVDADTSCDFHNPPVTFSWLRKGESVDVEFWPNHLPQAGRIHIEGMVCEY